MLREERQRLNSWPDTPMRKDQYLLLDERHDSNAGQHLLATQPLPRDPIRERFGAICPRLTQMAHEQRHIGPEKHGVRGGLQGLRKSSDTQDAELTDPQASTPRCFQETSPGPLPHILTRSLAHWSPLHLLGLSTLLLGPISQRFILFTSSSCQVIMAR